MSFHEIAHSVIEAFKHTGIIEWAGFITALAYIILIALEKSTGWIFGIISSALTVYLCYTGNLFFESGLNIFYVIIGFYGWYQWLYGSQGEKEIQIRQLSGFHNIYLILIGLVVWIPLAFLAHKYSTQSMPYLDAFITTFSIIATWMTAKKIIENWLYWIMIDTLGIVLFAGKGFYLYAVLNIIFTIMAVTGYISWRKKMKT